MGLLEGLDDLIVPLSEYERFLLELALSEREQLSGRSLTLAQRLRLAQAFLDARQQSACISLHKPNPGGVAGGLRTGLIVRTEFVYGHGVSP